MRRTPAQTPNTTPTPPRTVSPPHRRPSAPGAAISTTTPLSPTTHISAPTLRPGWAESANTWIEQHSTLAFTLLSALYFLTVACLSYMKLLWLDELITLHIARLNSASAIWHALASGADPNPPFIHLAVMLCRRLFGEHAFALRLPAALGYWVGMLALYLFLHRRVPATWALAGTVLSMGMGGFDWSYESRSYAIFYGLAMLALYAWSRAAELGATRLTRLWSLPVLALTLAGGICTNYFAVLAFLPIAFGELTRAFDLPCRSASRALLKRIDWPVWIVLAASATPLLIFRPLIKTSIALYAPYAWNKVSLDGAIYGYLDIVEAVLKPLVLLMAFIIVVEILAKVCTHCETAIHPRWLGRLVSARANARPEPLLSPAEAAAVSVLVAYPFLGYFVASFRGGMLSPRFVLPVCFGVAITATLLACRTFGHLRTAASFALLSTLLWFVVRMSYIANQYEVQKESFYRVLASIPSAEYPGQPLAISDNLLILPVRFYAPPEVASRVIAPIDFPAIMRNRGEAASEVNLWTGRDDTYDLPIVPLATVQRTTSTYIVLTSGREWLVDDLRRHSYDAQPLFIDCHAPGLELTITPLSHSRPVFFRATGDLYPHPFATPIPFHVSDNIPQPDTSTAETP